jgi:hypothetical protein
MRIEICWLVHVIDHLGAIMLTLRLYSNLSKIAQDMPLA